MPNAAYALSFPSGPAITRGLHDRTCITFGIALICVLLLLEAVTAHLRLPHPASPWVGVVLGGMGLAELAVGRLWQRRARAANNENRATGRA